MNGLDLLMQYETEGLSTLEEALVLANWLVETGLVNSTGSYQRFVANIQGDHDDD